jgi:hypothetical protein
VLLASELTGYNDIRATSQVPKKLRAEGCLAAVDRSISVTPGQYGSDLSHARFTPSIKDISSLLESDWRISVD